MQLYDLIGDIHGQASELNHLLEKLSYTKKMISGSTTIEKLFFLVTLLIEVMSKERSLTL
jgi:hypothetical protein